PPHQTGRADFPHPAFPTDSRVGYRGDNAISQELQTQTTSQKLVVGHARRWTAGTLTPTLQVDRESVHGMRVQDPVRTASETIAEVIAPAAQLTVDGLHQLLHRHMTMTAAGFITQVVPGSAEGLGRWHHGQKAACPIGVAPLVPEAVAEEIQLGIAL